VLLCALPGLLLGCSLRRRRSCSSGFGSDALLGRNARSLSRRRRRCSAAHAGISTRLSSRNGGCALRNTLSLHCFIECLSCARLGCLLRCASGCQADGFNLACYTFLLDCPLRIRPFARLFRLALKLSLTTRLSCPHCELRGDSFQALQLCFWVMILSIIHGASVFTTHLRCAPPRC
jgi:hypothetical protein